VCNKARKEGEQKFFVEEIFCSIVHGYFLASLQNAPSSFLKNVVGALRMLT
jgi:hypothetical protein